MTWALIFPELRCRFGSPVDMADLSYLLTYHFPAGIRFYYYFIIAAQKKSLKNKSQYFHLILQASECVPPLDIMSLGGWERHVMADHVTDDTVGL